MICPSRYFPVIYIGPDSVALRNTNPISSFRNGLLIGPPFWSRWASGATRHTRLAFRSKSARKKVLSSCWPAALVRLASFGFAAFNSFYVLCTSFLFFAFRICCDTVLSPPNGWARTLPRQSSPKCSCFPNANSPHSPRLVLYGYLFCVSSIRRPRTLLLSHRCAVFLAPDSLALVAFGFGTFAVSVLAFGYDIVIR